MSPVDGLLNPSWQPAPDDDVLAMTVSGGSLYIGGSFSSIGGTTAEGLARFDPTTGAVDTSWAPSADVDYLGTTALAVSGGTVAAAAPDPAHSGSSILYLLAVPDPPDTVTAPIAPALSQAPAVSGEAALTGTLSCSSGAWSGLPTPNLSYQWLRNGAAIGGATGSTHRITLADCGKRLSCLVTASNSAGRASALSNRLAVCAAPTLSLRAAPAEGATGTVVTLSGTVRNSLAAARTVCICRRIDGKLIVVKHVGLSRAGAFRCTWRAHGGRLWRFVARYTVAGYRFTSPVREVAHKR